MSRIEITKETAYAKLFTALMGSQQQRNVFLVEHSFNSARVQVEQFA